MREILFRGKRIDNGEWVYGQYAYLLNLRTEDGEPIKHMILDGTPFGQQIEISTVGQFTGLTDKNGKKIFEGDVVRYTYDSPDDPTATENGLIPRVGRIFLVGVESVICCDRREEWKCRHEQRRCRVCQRSKHL